MRDIPTAASSQAKIETARAQGPTYRLCALAIEKERMIRVNDKWDVRWQADMSVQDVLVASEFTHQHIVVTVNGVLVPPGEYSTHPVADGDEIRVVHVIGGG